MKSLRFAFCSGLLLAAFALAIDKISIPELLKEAKTYDGKTVETTGFVDQFKQKISRAGNKYFTFKLRAGEKDSASINVYSQGEAEETIKDGVKVKVIGVFREEKKVMDFTVKNEVDATKVKDKENGVKVLK